jgi:DNA-binding NtrC family response regulator
MKRILVVDDEKTIRRLYEEEFKKEGYAVLTTGSPEEAMAYCSRGDVDLVIMDLELKTKDEGINLLRRIKQHNEAMLVILNTAYADYQYDFITWVADAFVVKTENLSYLEGKVNEMLLTE